MYVGSGSEYQINIPHTMLKDIEAKMKDPQPDLFLAAQKSIFLLMVEGTFDYFVKSERYRAFQSM